MKISPRWLAAAALLGGALSSVAMEPSTARLRRHTTTLSSDAFEGRGPGTSGEETTVRYLADQFAAMGIAPGNPDGTYFQDVGLVGIYSDTKLTFRGEAITISPVRINECITWSRRATERITTQGSEVVFLGYGVNAPEFDWDDFKGIDLRGKTIVVLVNDPPVPASANPEMLDDAVFKGRAMTYYGRYDYKFETASARGAAACLIVHETSPAGYPFAVLTGSMSRENFGLDAPDGHANRVGLEGWITRDFAERLFAAGGHDFAALKAAAGRRDFQPVPLGLTLDYTVENTVRHISSRNVVGLLPGSDPALRDEYLVYTAHWDHLGRDDRLVGDQIFNGALDNASGSAVLLELAHLFADLPTDERPRRSILFLSVTAEERGLLGSRYYAENPLHPLERTVANINMDGANIYAETRDIENIGSGATTIEDLAAAVAASHGRELLPDSQSEKGFYYRSDHFEFAKVGVPAFYPKAGRIALYEDEDYIDRKRQEFTALHYHKVSDEVGPEWSFAGVAQDTVFLFEVGQAIADGDTWPEWKAGSEFKARRDAMLGREVTP